MSEHTDRVRHSVAVSNLRECKELLRSLPTADWDIEETYDLITRLIAVTDNVLGRLTIADRNLVPGHVIDALEGPSQEILEIVTSLKDSAPSVEIDLSNANERIDEILATASALPVLRIRTTNEVLERASEQFDREASSAKSSIATEVERLRSEMGAMSEQLQQTISEHTGLFDQLRESLDQRVNEAQESLGSLESRTNEATERLEREVTSIQEVFRESQRERADDHQRSQTKREQTFRERIELTAAEVEGFRDQARSMLEEVAGAGSAEHYAQQRDAHKASADSWRIIGACAFLALFLAAVGIFIDARLSDEEFSLVWLAARSGVLGSIAAFATIAMRQSSHHRRREEDISRVANELQLLWPFMNRLPDEDREILLRDITPLYFKGGLSAHDNENQAGRVKRARGGLVQRLRRPSDE